MSKTKLISVLMFIVGVLASCSHPRGNEGAQIPETNSTPQLRPIASAKVVKVTSSNVVIARGESAEAVLKVAINNGYHINANPPTFPYLKATELQFPAVKGISVGPVTYPAPVTKKFSFAEKPLAVYEGETAIKVRLKVDKSAKAGELNLFPKLRVQACDDQVCYPPGVVDITIPVTIQ